jgi:hypothetical protein
MRPVHLLFAIAFLLFSCGKEETPELTLTELEGTWLLTEVLFDPGDGSGEFEPSDAGFEITLRADNTFEANFHVCRIFEQGDRRNGDFVRIAEEELLISCNEQLLNSIQGRLEEGNLILYYPCIEPCIYKFRKVSDPKG